MTIPVFPIALGGALLVGLLTALAWQPMRREGRLQQKMVQLQATYPPLEGHVARRGPALARVAAAVGGVFTRSGILSPKAVADLSATVAASGLRGEQALPIFVGAKILLLGMFTGLGLLADRQFGLTGMISWATPAASAMFGLLAPDFALRTIRRRYLTAVERALPDALDLLVICSEAGLALEQGIDRVAHEIQTNSAACANELMMTRDELRIMADRRIALHNLAQRTGLVSLQRLAGTLVQALQYGTPLSQALRTLSAELRADALTRFEARAARLPVLLTLPMILLILPCVFLIVVGPAVMSIMDAMAQ
jgi:tight adherence protein C